MVAEWCFDEKCKFRQNNALTLWLVQRTDFIIFATQLINHQI